MYNKSFRNKQKDLGWYINAACMIIICMEKKKGRNGEEEGKLRILSEHARLE